MKMWWHVGAVAGLVLLGACQSSDSVRTVEGKPTPTVEPTLTGFEAGEALREVGWEAFVGVMEAMEGVQPAEGHEIATVTAKKFVDTTYEASDIAEFCEGIDVFMTLLAEEGFEEDAEVESFEAFRSGINQLKYISFEELETGGVGELASLPSCCEFPTTREVFDELMGRC